MLVKNISNSFIEFGNNQKARKTNKNNNKPSKPSSNQILTLNPKQNSNYSLVLAYPINSIDFSLRQKAIGAIDNDIPLSSDGFKGIVYRIKHNNKDYVVKIGRFADGDFSKEAEVLKKFQKH